MAVLRVLGSGLHGQCGSGYGSVVSRVESLETEGSCCIIPPFFIISVHSSFASVCCTILVTGLG